ncbi:MAG: hypothetical protein ACOX2F_01620 [bacterium]
MRSRFATLFFVLSLLLIILPSCNLSENEKAEIAKILEIRENLLNKGDIKSLEAFVTADFPSKKEYFDQLTYQRQYFLGLSYNMNAIKVLSSSMAGKKAHLLVSYDISFKSPEDVAETVWLDRKENITMVKEKIGWKIGDIKEIKNTGRKIEPQVVHDVFFVLDTRKTALNNGDYELFDTIISENYPQREKLIDDFKQNAAAFIDINYGLKGRRLQYLSEQLDEVRVTQNFDLVFNIKGSDAFEKIEDQRELISLKKIGEEGWKIVDGLR